MATVAPEAKHPRVVEAELAMREDRLAAAEGLLKQHVKEKPSDLRAVRLLAEVAERQGRLSMAEKLLRIVLKTDPGSKEAKAKLAAVLGRAGKPTEAMEIVDELLRAEPDSKGYLLLKATTLARLGKFEEAIDAYTLVLKRDPRRPRLWLSYGHVLKTVGRVDESITAYRKALALEPSLGVAWWSLANLKTVEFSDHDLLIMTTAVRRGKLRNDDRLHIDFALGKALHDRGRFDEAFRHYSAGNALRLQRRPANVGKTAQLVDKSVRTFTREVLSAPGGCQNPDPIFIVGMPRAGSTLVEQILASHSAVEGTAELPYIPAVLRGIREYPEAAAELSPEQRHAAGEDYLKRASVQRRTERPFFIDKLPNNWMYVPFILLTLPNAKIIDARRHPLGCCMSNFRQQFANGQEFTYDLGDLGRYYSEYVRLMAHVDAMLPGRVHRVIYEHMVDDTEAEVRALLDYCGLEFEPACLAFYETERSIRTPSAQQVRQPIYRGATQEWQAYDAHLGPLKEALGEVLDCYPDVPAAWKLHP